MAFLTWMPTKVLELLTVSEHDRHRGRGLSHHSREIFPRKLMLNYGALASRAILSLRRKGQLEALISPLTSYLLSR